MKKWSNALLLALLVTLGGCQHMEVSQREKQIDATMKPLLGKSKEEVVLALGAPREISTAGGIEIYKYHQSFGTRAQAAAAPNQYLVTAGAKSWEAYDSINCYFKDGIMVKWDGYVQR